MEIRQLELSQIISQGDKQGQSNKSKLQIPKIHENVRYSITDLKNQTNLFGGPSDKWINTEFFLSDLQVKQEEQNYFVIWNWGQYLEFFFYHIMFFFVLGPFLNIFMRFKQVYISDAIIYIQNGQILMRNQQFWGLNFSFIQQSVNYICFVICFYTYFYSKSIFYNLEFITINIYFLIRCHVIATKYATYCPSKILLIKSKLLSNSDIQEDLLVTWLSQRPSMVSKEIDFSCRRQNFDLSFFFLSFFFPLNEEKDIRLTEHLETMRLFYDSLNNQNLNNKFPPIQTNNIFQNQKLYFGHLILFDLNYIYKQKIFQDRMPILIAFLLSIFRAFFGVFARYIDGNQPFQSGFNGLAQFSCQFILLNMSFINYFVLIFSIEDLKRRLFHLNQASYLIQIQRNVNQNSYMKEFATINLIQPQSVKSWGMLRRLILDYGCGYYIRYQSMLIAFILYNICQLIYMILKLIGVFQTLDIYTLVISSYDFCFSILIMLIIFYYLASINAMFQTHKYMLLYNKGFVTNLARQDSIYFDKSFTSANDVYEEARIRIMKQFPDKKERKKYFKRLLEAYKDIMKMLDYDEDVRPYKLFGITITYEFLISITVPLLSALPTSILSSLNKLKG